MGGHPHDLARRLLAPWRNFRARGFIFLEESLVIRLWDVLVALGVAYSVLFLPLVMVFPQAQWHGYRALNTFIDTSLMIDVVVRFRTSFVDRGYPVLTSRLIALRYCRGWFIYDLLSSFPFTSFASNEGNVLRSTPTTAYALELTPLGMLSLLRVFSIGRLIRIIALVNSSQLVRQRPLAAVVLPVACLMFFFVLMAHYLCVHTHALSRCARLLRAPRATAVDAMPRSRNWRARARRTPAPRRARAQQPAAAREHRRRRGLVWYLIAVRPLEIDESFDGAQQWFWLQPAPFSAAYVVGVRYVCSLYWALGVMTNLKGLPAHETRQCLWHDPLVTNPLAERVFTIFVFIIGACFFSAIYGNIATFIQNLYAGGVRYRRRMDEVDELSRFYQIEGRCAAGWRACGTVEGECEWRPKRTIPLPSMELGSQTEPQHGAGIANGAPRIAPPRSEPHKRVPPMTEPQARTSLGPNECVPNGRPIQSQMSPHVGLYPPIRLSAWCACGRRHRLGSLQRRIRTHVDFTWAVTKGINMSTMAGGLPRHLQLEITLRLNRPMVAKWCGAAEFDPPPLCLPLLASGRDQAVVKPWATRDRAVIEP